jgi:dipeptidyl aminopeptidase/acylaminoacyl peptidase
MNCKWAEEHLSAYLDDALDPPLSGEVGEHVAQCAHCRAILDDYRRFDLLLAEYPRVEPPPELRDRIFSSPEFAALLRQEAVAQSAPRGETAEAEEPVAAGLKAQPLHPAAPPPRRAARVSRMLLPVAAMLTVALGAALLLKQGLLPSPHTSGPSMHTIGNPGDGAPLPAGTRLVYERDGAIWSEAANGQGIPQQLTPSGVQIAGWSVSPSTGQAGASMVAYIDARTGAIHVIRGDGLNDTTIGHVAGSTALDAAFWQTPAGQAAETNLSWAPDGTRVAYLAVTSADATILHVVNARGIGDTTIQAGAPGLVADPLWSGDSLHIAFTETRGDAQSVWAYNIATDQAHELAARAGATAAARATHVSWVAGAAARTLTWASMDGTRITGLYAARGDATASATRLTPAGASYDAAAFAPTSRGGLWLAAKGAKLSTVSAASGAVQQVATAHDPIARIAWSPDGSRAAVTGAHFVAVWSANRGLVTVAQGAVRADLVAWSADGKSLAYVVGDAVTSMGAGDNSHVVLAHLTDVVSLRWSPDGQRLAVATQTAVFLVTRDGASQATVDAHTAADGSLLWTAVK